MHDRSRLPIDRGQPLAAGRHAHLCCQCGRARAACTCRPAAARTAERSRPVPPADGVLRVGRQTSGRKGKGVTSVTGLRLAPAELAALCKALKQRCGAGGTVKDGVIEIQGEHRDTLVAELAARGYEVKRVGG